MTKILTLINLILFFSLSCFSQRNVMIEGDTTKLTGVNNSETQLIIVNGSQDKTNSYLKNIGGGLTKFDYPVDSVWVLNDTLHIKKEAVTKYKLNNSAMEYLSGVSYIDGSVSLGGQLLKHTTIKLNDFNYQIQNDSVNFSNNFPQEFKTMRSNGNFTSIINQKPHYFETFVSNQNNKKSIFALNDSTAGLYTLDNLTVLSSISLDKKDIKYTANTHSFQGDWLRVPTRLQDDIQSFDTKPAGALVYNTKTQGIQLSDGDNFSPVSWEYLDQDEIATIIPRAWATEANVKIPVLRLRHPLNVTGINGHPSMARDFKILPYQYGIAVEYNGVLENWVGEFSIHKGHNYHDMGDGGDGWGAVLWVGDDEDRGGLRMTARDNTFLGGNIRFTEIASEKFGGQATAGNLRLRAIDNNDRFDFVIGQRASSNVISYISNSGIKFPSTENTGLISTPEKGLTVFDNADNNLKVFNGVEWNNLVDSRQASEVINSNQLIEPQSAKIKYIDAVDENITITLPDASSVKAELVYKVIRLDNSVYNVLITTSNSDTINGAPTKVVDNRFECLNLYSDGNNRWIITSEAAY